MPTLTGFWSKFRLAPAPHAVGERRYSLRASLLGLVAACLLPAALIAGGLTYKHYASQRDRTYEGTLQTARQLSSRLDRELSAIEAALRVLAQSPALAAGDLAAFHVAASKAVTGRVIDNFVLTDRQGRQRVNTLVPYGAPLPTAGTPAQLSAVFTDGKPVLADLFIGPVTGKPVIAMGVPVYDADKVLYSLNTGVAAERMNALLAENPLPPGWVAAVLDSSGAIVARSRESQRFVGHKASAEVLEQVFSGASGTIETRTKEGTRAISSLSRSSMSGWSVAVGAPKSVLDAQLLVLMAWVTAGLAASIGVGLWLASRLAARVTDAVRQLNEAALALGRRATVVQPTTRLIEADAVAEAIERASHILKESQYLAQHDPLTGLSNRLLFDEMLKHQVAATQRSGGSFAVLAIDLDGFKAVNDQHGHAIGDAVLQQAAHRIASSVRGADVVARLGGDEFAVLLTDADLQSARLWAERLIAAVSQPYDRARTGISASVGVAVFTRADADGAALMHRADAALYAAKRLGKARVELAR